MKYDFNFFKQNVSIIQVAESLGYKFNPLAGRTRLEFVHPDMPNVIISNPKDPSRQVYFTRNVDGDRGSVIDFVKHRLNMFNVSYFNETEGINKVLSSFAQVPYDITRKLEVLQVRNSRPFDPEAYNISEARLSDLLYLSRERGLSDETLQNFMPYIHMVQTREKNYNFRNIGFPYTVPGSDKVVGYELVNYNFKQHADGSDKVNSMWMADLSSHGKPTDIYVAESAIDAMSYYQLFKHRNNFDTALFASTGGNLSNAQIRNAVDKFPHSRLHTIFDNDLAGKLYDIRVACIKDKKELSISKMPEHVVFSLDKGVFKMPAAEVSFPRFKELTGFRPDIRVHKPTSKDFNLMLTTLNNEHSRTPQR